MPIRFGQPRRLPVLPSRRQCRGAQLPQVLMTLTGPSGDFYALDGPLEFAGQYQSNPVAICGLVLCAGRWTP